MRSYKAEPIIIKLTKLLKSVIENILLTYFTHEGWLYSDYIFFNLFPLFKNNDISGLADKFTFSGVSNRDVVTVCTRYINQTLFDLKQRYHLRWQGLGSFLNRRQK